MKIEEGKQSATEENKKSPYEANLFSRLFFTYMSYAMSLANERENMGTSLKGMNIPWTSIKILRGRYISNDQGELFRPDIQPVLEEIRRNQVYLQGPGLCSRLHNPLANLAPPFLQYVSSILTHLHW